MTRSQRHALQAAVATLLALALPAPRAAGEPAAARGQLLYLPVYSEIPYGDRQHTATLTATVSVRNTDRARPIRVTRVDYFDSGGKFLRSYLASPALELGPLAAEEFVVKESDRTGGISASFLVEWSADSPVSPPCVEAVMISTRWQQGISFLTQSRVLEERP